MSSREVARGPRRRAVLLLFLLSPLLATPAVGGEAAAAISEGASGGGAASPTSPGIASPVPQALIPVAEIGSESIRVNERLRAALTEIRRGFSVRQVEREVPPILNSVSGLTSAQAGLQPSQLTGRAVTSLRQEWLLDEARLDAVEKTLAAKVQTLLELRGEIRQVLETWERSRDAAVKASAPGPIIDQADAILRLARDVKSALDSRLAPLLALRQRVSEAQLAVSDGLEWVESAAVEVKRDLLRLDSPPLWAAFSGTVRQIPSAFPERPDPATLRRSLESFIRAYRGRVELHLVAAACFLVLLLRIRSASRKGTGASAGVESEAVIARPLSSVLIVGLLVALVAYPRAPVVFFELVAAASIPPALILLPKLATPRGKRALFCLTGLFVALRFMVLVMQDSLAIRLFLAVVSLAGILVLAWWLRPASSFRAFSPEPRRDVPRGVTKGALVILVVALVMNVVGNVSLAHLLTLGTVNSAYLAMMLYLAFLLVQGLVAALLASPYARRVNTVRVQGDLIRRHLMRWTFLACVVLWTHTTVVLFGFSGLLYGFFGAMQTTRWKLGMVTISPASILVFGITLWLSALLSRLVAFILEGDVFPRLGLARGVPEIVSMMVRYGLITCGFLLAVAAAGVELSQFAIIAGALGVGIGFGLQNIVSNFISGLILLFERPIRVDDFIQVGSLFGQVRHIGVRGSTLRTPEGADVVVPNANLISNEVVNWTLSDPLRRMEIQVGVAYGTDPARVLALLQQAALAHPEVLREPAPLPLFIRFGESSLDFSLRFWTDNFEDWVPIQSAVAVGVHDALRDAGIRIPFPQRDLRVLVAEGGGTPGMPPARTGG